MSPQLGALQENKHFIFDVSPCWKKQTSINGRRRDVWTFNSFSRALSLSQRSPEIIWDKMRPKLGVSLVNVETSRGEETTVTSQHIRKSSKSYHTELQQWLRNPHQMNLKADTLHKCIFLPWQSGRVIVWYPMDPVGIIPSSWILWTSRTKKQFYMSVQWHNKPIFCLQCPMGHQF